MFAVHVLECFFVCLCGTVFHIAAFRVFSLKTEKLFFHFSSSLPTELIEVVFMLLCCCTALHLSLRRLHEARYLINDIRRAQVEGERQYSF